MYVLVCSVSTDGLCIALDKIVMGRREFYSEGRREIDGLSQFEVYFQQV